jgi:hypothetical protein
VAAGAVVVGGSSAGRLCCGRLRGDQPPTSAGLAVAPTDIRRRVGKPRRPTRSAPSPPRYSDKQRPAASCFPAGLEIRVTTSAIVASGFDDCVARTSLHCRRTCDVRVGIRCLCRPARERALDVVDAPDVTRGGAGCYRRASMARLASAASVGGMYTRPPLSRSSVRPSAAVAAGGPLVFTPLLRASVTKFPAVVQDRRSVRHESARFLPCRTREIGVARRQTHSHTSPPKMIYGKVY